MNIVSKCVLSIALLGAVALVGKSAAVAETERQGILLPSYRIGPFAPNGIGQSDAIVDYITLLNERDGGLNGTKLFIQECETQYDNERGVECYERYKTLNPVGLSGVLPLSAGIGYALYDRALADKVPIITPGYGRLQGAVGNLFPYEFPIVGNDWEQTTAIMTYIAGKVGGFDKLKGQKSRWYISTRLTARSRSRCWTRWPNDMAWRGRGTRSLRPQWWNRALPGCRYDATSPTTS